MIMLVIASLMYACSGEGGKTMDKEEARLPDQAINLWNGTDFEGWDFYLSDSTVNPMDVWSVQEGILHCTGIPSGYIVTKEEYENYRLVVEWRWPAEPGNSGVLLHTQKPDTVWPVCIEAQLKTGDAGDFYMIGGTSVNQQEDPANRRIQKRADSSEKEPGKWNRYEITCSADSIHLVVNDVEQNAAGGATVSRGRIAFQSEGKPIEFRKIELSRL